MQWVFSCRHVHGYLPSQRPCTLLDLAQEEEDLQQQTHADVARLLSLLMCWVQAAHDTHSPEGSGTTEGCRERPVVKSHCWVHSLAWPFMPCRSWG